MAANVLDWLRKYCCYVLNCQSKNDDSREDDVTHAKEEHNRKPDAYDLPYSDENVIGRRLVPIRNYKPDTGSPRDKKVLSVGCRTLPMKSEPRRGSLLRKVKSHGVRLPGMGSNKRPLSLSPPCETLNPDEYCNVNFTRRLIQKIDWETQRSKPDNVDKCGIASVENSTGEYRRPKDVIGQPNDCHTYEMDATEVYENESQYHISKPTDTTGVGSDLYENVALIRNKNELRNVSLTKDSQNITLEGVSLYESDDCTRGLDNPGSNQVFDDLNIETVSISDQTMVYDTAYEGSDDESFARQHTYINEIQSDNKIDKGWEENTAYQSAEIPDNNWSKIEEQNNDKDGLGENFTGYQNNTTAIGIQTSSVPVKNNQLQKIEKHDNTEGWEENPAYDSNTTTCLPHVTLSVPLENTKLLKMEKHNDMEGWEENPAYSSNTTTICPPRVALSVTTKNTQLSKMEKHDVMEGWEENPAYQRSTSTAYDETVPCEVKELEAESHVQRTKPTVHKTTSNRSCNKWVSDKEMLDNSGLSDTYQVLNTETMLDEETAYDTECFKIYDNVFEEEGWEDQKLNHQKFKIVNNLDLPLNVGKRPISIRSEEISAGVGINRPQVNKRVRNRAYTESMVMRNNFQQDLRMALNARFQKRGRLDQ